MNCQEKVSPVGAGLLKKCQAKAFKDMAQTAHATRSESYSGKAVESQNFQTVEAGDKSSAIPGRLMVDWIPADRLGQSLAYVQKTAGLRSLEEIADEIGLLLTLTDEQDSDSLALRKLKRALIRKQLIQVQAEVATLHKAVREAMGDSVWRWDF
jgi:hypothetical protein